MKMCQNCHLQMCTELCEWALIFEKALYLMYFGCYLVKRAQVEAAR